jgi:hypothetical protein
MVGGCGVDGRGRWPQRPPVRRSIRSITGLQMETAIMTTMVLTVMVLTGSSKVT